MTQDLGKLTARETAGLVAARKLSAVETTTAAIERIEARNPSLNAVIFKDCDGALARARALDDRIMRSEPVGRMAGVPTLMKDLFDFRPGWPTTFGGVPALKDFVPDFWSAYPQRTEGADAIMLGKTNSTVLGFCGTSDNPLFGPTANPFDLSRNSGGSSGGSAAAVADGMVAVAGANDGGGSIRIPSSWSGTAGFQPSFGRVPAVMRPNAFGTVNSFAYEGPVARNVGDLALAMNCMAGYDPLDPFSNPETIDFDIALRGDIAGKRVGFTPDFGVFPVDPAVADTVSEAVRAFEEAGAIVEMADLRLPFDQMELYRLLSRMIGVNYRAFVEGLRSRGLDLLVDHRDELPEELIQCIEQAAGFSVLDVQADQLMRSQVFDCFATTFARYDLIVAPTTAVQATKNNLAGETVGPTQINGVAVNPRIGWCMTYMTNMTGHAAASVPAGLVDGLPVGLQIIGRRYGDLDVMAAAAAFERQRPWQWIYEIPDNRLLA